jgi:hypothetical protein
LLEVIRGANDEQPIVAFESVKLIKEEGSVVVIDQTVQVFQDDNARRELASFVENVGHCSFFAFVT